MELLKKELPVYLSKCADTDENFCPLEWWKQNALAVPNWAISASKVLLVQPPLSVCFLSCSSTIVVETNYIFLNFITIILFLCH